MKFYLFLLFLLLLFDSPQISAIALKRSKRALNTTLQTNFNGTYERRNPCTNAEIETTSYIASHEFRHHTKEDHWSDYTNKCSSIISSFLRALGSLVRFNYKQNGVFNFHINTSISQKQDGNCEPGTANSLPVITIEATDCEISPKASQGTSAVTDTEQIYQNEAETLNEREDSVFDEETTSRTAPTKDYINQDFSSQTTQCQTKIPSTQAEENLPENILPPYDIFSPAEEVAPTTSGLVEHLSTEDPSQAFNDLSEDIQTIFEPEQKSDFVETDTKRTAPFGRENDIAFQEGIPERPPAEENPNLPYILSQTYPSTIPYGQEQPSEQPFLIKEQKIGFPKQHSNDNLDAKIFLPNEQTADSFSSSGQIPPRFFNSKEASSPGINQPESTYQVDQLSLKYPFQTGERQSKEINAEQQESFQQPVQNKKQANSFSYQNIRQTEPGSDAPQTDSLDQLPPSQRPYPKLPPVPNFNPSAKEFVDYDGLTPSLEFSMSYPEPLAQVPLRKKINSFNDEDNSEEAKPKLYVDYINEFSKTQEPFKNSEGFSLSPGEKVIFADKLSDFNVRTPHTIEPIWTPQPFSTEKTDASSTQSLLSASEILNQSSDEHIREATTNAAADAEFPIPLDQYQLATKPESQSLVKYPDQYSNANQLELSSTQSEPDISGSEPYLFFSPTSSERTSTERTPPLEHSTLTSLNQNVFPHTSTYDKPSNYELGSSSNQKQTEQPESVSTIQTNSEEYLRTLPPDQESIKNSEGIISTFNPYQKQPTISEAVLPSSYSDLPLNYKMTTPIPNAYDIDFEQGPILSSPTTPDDYEDLLNSKPDIKPSPTTPLQYDGYDLEPSSAKDQATQFIDGGQLPFLASNTQRQTQTPEPFELEAQRFSKSFSSTFPTESPQFSEQYSNTDAMISSSPEQNPATPNSEISLQGDRSPPTPEPFREDDFPHQQTLLTPVPPNFDTAKISEQVTADDYQIPQTNFPLDLDSTSRKFSPKFFKTSLPENSNSLVQSPILPVQFEEPLSAPPTLTADLNENNSDFLTENDSDELFEPLQLTTQVYASQSSQPLSPETPSASHGKQYFSAEQRKPQTAVISEYDSTPQYEPNEELVKDIETPLPDINKGNDFVTYPSAYEQFTGTFAQETNEKEPFFSTTQPPLTQTSHSHKDQLQQKLELFKAESLTTASSDNQLLPLESQLESNPPFLDDEPSTSVLEQTPSSPQAPFLSKNQDLQFNDFQTPFTQTESPAPYLNKPSVSDFAFDSALSPLREPNQQSVTQPLQPDFAASQPQPDQIYDKEPTDYPALSESASQPQSPDNYNKRGSDSYSTINLGPQTEYSSTAPTSFEGYSDPTSIAPSSLKLEPSFNNERPESQNVQENIPDYSFSVSSHSLQRGVDYSTNSPDNYSAEVSQSRDFENRFPSQEDSETAEAMSQFSDNIEIYPQGTNYNQGTQTKPTYLNQLPTSNLNTPAPDINKRDSQFFQPPLVQESPVLSPKLKLRNFAFPSGQTFATPNLKPAETLNESSQRTSIPLQDAFEAQSDQEISDTFNNISQQYQSATAEKYDDKMTGFQAFEQQKESLDFPKHYSDSSDQQVPVTSYSSPSETEPLSIPLEKSMAFDSFDKDLNNQTPFLFQPQRQEQLDTMKSSIEQIQNDFNSNLPFQNTFSSLSKPTKAETLGQTIENIEQPSAPINPDYSSDGDEELLSLYDNQNESEPQQLQPKPGLYSRYSPRFPFQQPQNLNVEAFPDPEAQRLTASSNRQDFDPEEGFIPQSQTQITKPHYFNTFDASSVDTKERQTLSASQYQTDFSNQTPNGKNESTSSINAQTERPTNLQPIDFDPKVTPQYPVSDANQAEDFLPLDSVPYFQKPQIEQLPDQTISNRPYDDYDHSFPPQLPNEKLLEYDVEITPNLKGQKGPVQTNEQQNSDMAGQSLEDFHDYQDRPTLSSESPSFPSSPVSSNPLLQALEHNLSFPVHEHLGPPSFSESGQGSSKGFLSQNEFRGASAVPSNSRDWDYEDVVNEPQSDFQALVSDPNAPSNKPGEDCVTCCGAGSTPLLCPFDPVIKGNMSAPSYYILISKLPVDVREEEQYKVEKVYLGDGTPLNCTLGTGKTFPTWLYTPIPFSTADTVKLRTKSDFA